MVTETDPPMTSPPLSKIHLFANPQAQLSFVISFKTMKIMEFVIIFDLTCPCRLINRGRAYSTHTEHLEILLHLWSLREYTLFHLPLQFSIMHQGGERMRLGWAINCFSLIFRFVTDNRGCDVRGFNVFLVYCTYKVKWKPLFCYG